MSAVWLKRLHNSSLFNPLLHTSLGFVGSDGHGLLKETLAAKGYHLQEFILSPTDFGIPYIRPR